MKKVYICGDSFGCPDMNWQITPWPILLNELLGNNYTVTNLSICCASNLLISMQVDKAISEQADFVILLATTCTRGQGIKQDLADKHTSLYDRFTRIAANDQHASSRDLACYSIHSLNETCVFPNSTMTVIKDYHSRLFDLDLAIYENQCIIESSLYKLINSRIPFLFDQGGFENPSFGNVRKQDYFKNFDRYRSELNQWTLSKIAPNKNHSHFHITDPQLHAQIAEYYTKIIYTHT